MKTEQLERPVRVGLISLGCAKNLVDAEIMLGSLLKAGVEIINVQGNGSRLAPMPRNPPKLKTA